MKHTHFLCPNCNYQFTGSANEDFFGYQTRALTMICRVCSSLVDVVIQAGSLGPDRFYRKCPKCASSKLSPWNPLVMPCPKCGASMQKNPA